MPFLLLLLNLNRQYETARKKIEPFLMRTFISATLPIRLINKNICVQRSPFRQGIFYSLPSHPSSSDCTKAVLLCLGGSLFIPYISIMPIGDVVIPVSCAWSCLNDYLYSISPTNISASKTISLLLTHLWAACEKQKACFQLLGHSLPPDYTVYPITPARPFYCSLHL